MTSSAIADTLPAKPVPPPVDKWVPLLRETLEREGTFSWRVEGQSMMPTLPPDCTIEIVPVTGAARIGDLLVFAERQALVVHRLVARRGELLLLQGDNRKVPDAPVAPGQIIGRVARAFRGSDLIYPHTLLTPVAVFWLARYYWFKVGRVLRRFLSDKGFK